MDASMSRKSKVATRKTKQTRNQRCQDKKISWNQRKLLNFQTVKPVIIDAVSYKTRLKSYQKIRGMETVKVHMRAIWYKKVCRLFIRNKKVHVEIAPKISSFLEMSNNLVISKIRFDWCESRKRHKEDRTKASNLLKMKKKVILKKIKSKIKPIIFKHL